MIAQLDRKPQADQPQASYDIEISPDGITDAELTAVANRFAEYQYDQSVKRSLKRKLMSIFGLFYRPKPE